MSLKKLFKPEQFIGLSSDLHYQVNAARIAQAILDETLASAPRVYGPRSQDDWSILRRTPEGRFAIISSFKEDTHQALLVCIEELSKPECVHKLATHKEGNKPWQASLGFVCSKCGVNLKVPEQWEAE